METMTVTDVKVANDTERDVRERKVYRMVAAGLMIGGWAIGIANTMGWVRF